MTRFLDGPAAGVTLMLKRAPRLLRVVRAAGGEWDALDQFEDTPGSEEAITVYRMVSGPTWMHVNRGRKSGGSGVFRGGEYRVLTEQPADDILRDRLKWQTWAQAIWPQFAEVRA